MTLIRHLGLKARGPGTRGLEKGEGRGWAAQCASGLTNTRQIGVPTRIQTRTSSH